jgi:cell division protein FtsB
MRLVALALLLLIVLVQGELWLGTTGVPRVMELQAQVREQRTVNEAAKARNDQLTAEVRDLKDGLEMVEEKARLDLGMVRADELLVQYTRPSR